jgi:hypothetical protein
MHVHFLTKKRIHAPLLGIPDKISASWSHMVSIMNAYKYSVFRTCGRLVLLYSFYEENTVTWFCFGQWNLNRHTFCHFMTKILKTLVTFSRGYFSFSFFFTIILMRWNFYNPEFPSFLGTLSPPIWPNWIVWARKNLHVIKLLRL